jgi:HAD domain in Swiss Army Knife RNA repair proteins
MQKIIFIDIDGPIINTPCYYLDMNCSINRSVMNTQSLGYVTKLAKLANAKIVTNTTHNTFNLEDLITGATRTIKDDLIAWGIPEDLFHEYSYTNYPNPIGGKYAKHGQSHGRLRSIEQWQEQHGLADWLCFDDEPFTDDPRLLVIDFDLGIDYKAFKDALANWNISNSLLI